MTNEAAERQKAGESQIVYGEISGPMTPSKFYRTVVENFRQRLEAENGPDSMKTLTGVVERAEAQEALTPRGEAVLHALNDAMLAHYLEEAARANFERNERQLDGAKNADARRVELSDVETAAEGATATLAQLSVAVDGYAQEIGTEDLPCSRQKKTVSTPRRKNEGVLEALRAPMSLPMKDVITGFISGRFQPTDGGEGVYAKIGETQIRIDCDPAVGFLPEVAIHEIAKRGAAVVQTLLTISNLWMRENRGKKYNTYLEGVTAAEVLRLMGRKELPKGGHRSEDQVEVGQRVWMLSNTSVPVAQIPEYAGKSKKPLTLSLGKLIIVDAIDHEVRLDGSMKSMVRFNFHLGKHLHDWLDGGNEWLDVSTRLLSYHPTEDKYAIVFGWCLLYYQKVNAKHKRTQERISLTSLLNMAGVEIPERNPSRAVKQWERAFSQIADDGVIPGLTFSKPIDASLSISEIIRRSELVLPSLSRSLAASNSAQQVMQLN